MTRTDPELIVRIWKLGMGATAAGKDGHGSRLRGIAVSAELPDVKPYVLAHSTGAEIALSAGDRRVKGELMPSH